MVKTTLLTALAVLGLANGASACPLTIPEVVRLRTPHPVEQYRTADRLPIPLRELAQRAQIIVEAEVRPIRTYLSADQCDVLTDFAIVPTAVVAGAMPARTTPGPQPFVVTQFGGEMLVNGVLVTAGELDLPVFTAGERLVLFLRPSLRDKTKFELMGDVSGAFRIQQNGRVAPMMKGPLEDPDSEAPDRDTFVRRAREFRQLGRQ